MDILYNKVKSSYKVHLSTVQCVCLVVYKYKKGGLSGCSQVQEGMFVWLLQKGSPLAII